MHIEVGVSNACHTRQDFTIHKNTLPLAQLMLMVSKYSVQMSEYKSIPCLFVVMCSRRGLLSPVTAVSGSSLVPVESPTVSFDFDR